MSAPELSILVPSFRSSHGTGESLRDLLRDLRAQLDAPPFETIVVINPPDPGLENRLAREYPGVRVASCAPAGANRARNTGVALASAPLLLFLDDDCRIRDPHFLRRHAQAHGSLPEIAAIGGCYEAPVRASALDRTYCGIQRRWLEQGHTPRLGANYLLGGNFSLKAGMIGDLRFDPALRFGGTETELFWRLRQAGLRLQLDPALIVEHGPKLNWSRFAQKAFLQGIGSAYLASKRAINPGPRWGALKFASDARSSRAEGARLFVYDSIFQIGFAFHTRTGQLRASARYWPAVAWCALSFAIRLGIARGPRAWLYRALQVLRAGKELGRL